jgi:hypothetical protein
MSSARLAGWYSRPKALVGKRNEHVEERLELRVTFPEGARFCGVTDFVEDVRHFILTSFWSKSILSVPIDNRRYCCSDSRPAAELSVR